MSEASAGRKASCEIDPEKVDAAKEILGTSTLADTIDAALAEVIKLHQREVLFELLLKPGALDLDDPEVTSGAWRCVP